MKKTIVATQGLLAMMLIFFPTERVLASKKSKKKIELASNSKKISVAKTRYNRDESQDNREDKQFMITATPIGVGAGVITGLNAGFYLQPDLILGAKIESHSLALNFLGMDLYKSETKRAGVFGKYFLGNSFYLDGGLVGSISEFTMNNVGLNSSTGFYEYRHYERWQHGGIDLAIGNQWQWDHFTLGTDWFGIYQPLVKKLAEYENTAPEGEGEEETKISLNHARILALYLGMSF